MNNAIGIPKGMCVVLEERRINTKGMNADKMRKFKVAILISKIKK